MVQSEKSAVCDCKIIHQAIVDLVNTKMPDKKIFYDLAELFKVLGDITRVRILYALFTVEMCVCDLANALNMTHSAISHQLRILKTNRLVKYRKQGKIVYYSLDDEHIKQIFDDGLTHINE